MALYCSIQHALCRIFQLLWLILLPFWSNPIQIRVIIAYPHNRCKWYRPNRRRRKIRDSWQIADFLTSLAQNDPLFIAVVFSRRCISNQPYDAMAPWLRGSVGATHSFWPRVACKSVVCIIPWEKSSICFRILWRNRRCKTRYVIRYEYLKNI